MCCTRLAGNTGRKKSPFWHHCTTLSGYVFGTKACIDNRKTLVKQQYSSTCPDNMANFGLLRAEICWRVWGTPANFNGFHVFAALLHGTLVVGVSHNFAALNRGRHLYSAVCSIVPWWGGPGGTEARSLGLLLPSVLWHCWLGHLTCKTHPRYEL